ncbi:MAG: PaaI family thioesterase [Blastocatellia bacterium]
MKIEGNIEFIVIEQSQEQVISEMPIQPGIINPYGVVHAGAMLWFADVTATILAMGSSATNENMSGFPLAINLNANFISNQKEGKFKAISSFVKKGKTFTIVRTVILGSNDRVIVDITTNHVSSK